MGDGKDIFVVKVHEGKYTRNIYLNRLIVVVCESVCEGVLGGVRGCWGCPPS